MNIAVVVTPENTVPPKDYGGAERVAHVMVTQLMKRGHTVDLYCAPGSKCKATNRISTPQFGMKYEPALVHMLYKNGVEQYDCIIDYAALHIASQQGWKNTFGLVGGDPYCKYPHDAVPNRVYVSKEFAGFNGCPDHPILRNPVCNTPSMVPLGKGDGGYVLYVGVLSAYKDLMDAAVACRLLRISLHVYGPIKDSHIPRMDYIMRESSFAGKEYVVYNHRLGQAGRQEVFGKALAFVHPIQVIDADPLSPKEAMLCGTPVVACPLGGIRSTIEEGVNGYYAWTQEGFKNQILKAMKLDRKLVRASIMKQISPSTYGRDVEATCERVARGETW